jgi:hypothetical protein
MREIRFQAWDGQEMYVSPTGSLHDLATWLEAHSAGGPNGREKDSQLRQYAEVKDKIGRDICEGDILRCGFSDNLFEVRLVPAGWGLFSQGFPGSICTASSFPAYAEESFIIGNIYQNPKLLK